MRGSRGRWLAALCVALLGADPAPVQAEGGGIGAWSTALYHRGPAPPAPAARAPTSRTPALPPEAACVDAILQAEREAAIADHMLLAMGFTEAGRMTQDRLFTVWPWTVNAEGRSSYFPTKADAIAHVRGLQARGLQSIDVGCLQVNLKWHPDAFPDLDTAFDPRTNTRYAARFLGALYQRHGSLAEAVGRYHSAQSERGEAYRQRVTGNMRWAARALDYLRTLAAGPTPVAQPVTQGPADRARAAPVWGKADLGRLAFLSSLFADGPARPLLPDVAEARP